MGDAGASKRAPDLDKKGGGFDVKGVPFLLKSARLFFKSPGELE